MNLINIKKYLFKVIVVETAIFLFKWFQKKHTVVEVTTRELNPYVEEKIQKYIQIID